MWNYIESLIPSELREIFIYFELLGVKRYGLSVLAGERRDSKHSARLVAHVYDKPPSLHLITH